MVQALRINTLSKLTFSDCARFNALMKDVFPGIEFKDIEYEELAEAIRSVCKEANLRVNEIQVGTLYLMDWLLMQFLYSVEQLAQLKRYCIVQKSVVNYNHCCEIIRNFSGAIFLILRVSFIRECASSTNYKTKSLLLTYRYNDVTWFSPKVCKKLSILFSSNCNKKFTFFITTKWWHSYIEKM